MLKNIKIVNMDIKSLRKILLKKGFLIFKTFLKNKIVCKIYLKISFASILIIIFSTFCHQDITIPQKFSNQIQK